MFVCIRNVIGLAVDSDGVAIVIAILRPSIGWVVTLPATAVALALLPALAVLLEIVVYLTHRPIVEHGVIDRTLWQVHDSLTRTIDRAFDVCNDVVHNHVSGNVCELAILLEHIHTSGQLLQCHMKILMQYQTTHLWLGVDSL